MSGEFGSMVSDQGRGRFLVDGSAANHPAAAALGVADTGLVGSASFGSGELAPDRSAGRSWRPDRRHLVAAGAGALVTGALMRWFGGFALGRGGAEMGGARAQTGGTWVPPTWWDDLPPTSRNFYLAWDQLVWNLEQTPSGTANLHEALRTFLLTPGYQDLKQNIVIFLEDTRRTAYHWDILHALVPGTSSPVVHGMVFACLTAHIAHFGPSVVTVDVVNALLLYRDQNLAPTPSCLIAVNHVLGAVGH